MQFSCHVSQTGKSSRRSGWSTVNCSRTHWAILRSMITAVAMSCGAYSSEAMDDEYASDTYVENPITESDRDHWSLRPRANVEVPKSASVEWRHNEIDDFIAAELERLGLTPQPEASRRTLIRRVTLNLTGLPPAPDETARFFADESPEAFATLVNRLLQSPAYGERWAQHWLDLARFAETDGFEHDLVRSDAWRYRDWVIDALNADMPYDRFIRLQIAGDLLEPGNAAAAIATQFCVSGPDMPDINSQDERRHTLLNEMTATVGEVILGLQIGCAQCHDHKYDPISQADFYRLRAIFEPAISLKKNSSVTGLREQTAYERTSHVMIRGDYRRPGLQVSPDVPRVLNSESLRYKFPSQGGSDSRRIALANWLVESDHPLTPRVIVNRIWQHHFGTGLSETPSDFGVMGAEPESGPLLDWLAGWFVNNGWSMKKLHRLIVTSATWRQRSFLPASASTDEASAWAISLSGDSEARLLSRFPRQRLEGEVIRDAMLHAAGILNRKTGGPGIRPTLPEELRGTLLKDQWNVSENESEHHRRSIYVFARRNLRFPIFDAFDRPSANESCSRRTVSTTAPQALHLMNSEFSLRMAELIATDAGAKNPERDQQISHSFERILNRLPTADELTTMNAFLDESQDGDSHGMTHLCLSLLNCNEFVFVD